MKLDVWMEAVEAPVGKLERHADKSLEFAYARGVPKEGRLSAALPIKNTAFGDAACTAFFGNLLFEGREIPEEPQGDLLAIGVWGQYIYIDPAREVVIVKTSADADFDDNNHESVAAFRAIARAVAGEGAL